MSNFVASLASSVSARRLARQASRSTSRIGAEEPQPPIVRQASSRSNLNRPASNLDSAEAMPSAPDMIAPLPPRLERRPNGVPLTAGASEEDEADVDPEANDDGDDFDSVCLLCCNAVRQVRLHPCGHATSCWYCAMRSLNPADRRLRCATCRVDAQAVLLLQPLEPATSTTTAPAAAPPALMRHPTFQSTQTEATMALETFIERLTTQTADLELAALAGEQLQRWRREHNQSSFQVPSNPVQEAVVSNRGVEQLRSALAQRVCSRSVLVMALQSAAYRGVDEEMVRALLDAEQLLGASERSPPLIECERRQDHATPLWVAASRGHAAIVRLLLERSADVTKVATAFQATPLQIACQEGYAPCVQLLLDASASMEPATTEGSFPLYAAASKGRTDVVDLLIERYGADVNRVTANRGGSSLYAACWAHCPDFSSRCFLSALVPYSPCRAARCWDIASFSLRC